jgi:hypothetical protein
VKKANLALAKAILGKLNAAPEFTDGISPLPREEYSAEEASFPLYSLPENVARENLPETSAVVDSRV